ncbi:DNA polymerase I [Desulfuribacillus alkaliarsenatis]|uniref:DNA polymerase I n=1 Tax=Desulfuribacillus alkaliarsenatis TaxID=766136 RepID=UPI003F537E78
MLLIDGNSVANRAFYALPMLSNKQGVYTNAALGFTMMLLKLLEDEQPDYIACIFDAGKKTFRHDTYKDYKGKREKTPHELSGQFPIIKSIIDAFDIPTYELANYEADDIMGTFAQQAKAEQVKTALVSGDKDTFQLINDLTVVYMTKKGISDMEVIDAAALMEKYNLKPTQMVDLKGLMGDSSDNIPGVPGVGEKTALKLLHEYDSLENVLENIDNISGNKLKERLTDNKEQAILSKQLATINTNVPLSIDWEKASYEGYQKEKVRPLFEELEFKQLIDRLGLDIDGERGTDNIADRQKIEFTEITSAQALEASLSAINQSCPVAIYIETSGTNYHTDEILAIAIAQKDINFVCDKQILDDKNLLKLIEQATLYVYDAKRTYYLGKRLGISMSKIKTDIMLMNYLIDPTNSDKELAEIANAYGVKSATEETVYGKNRKDITKISKEQLFSYVATKANAVNSLVANLEAKLMENFLDSLLYDIELPLSLVLADMERQGINVDSNILENIGDELTEKITTITQEIYELAGEEFNINSPKQMGVILFDKLGLPPIKKTKTGYSTSADVLEKLANQHPIVDNILLHRQLVKLQSTYIEGLLKVINKDTNKIHTYYNQALTATGRLSSTEPNLQNIPIRLEEGRKIRKAFIPAKSGWKLLAADYSQIELRILAHIAQDENLIEAFQQGIDIHTKTASDVFGVALDEVTSLMRRQAKAVNFGIVYGISDYGLSQNLNIARKEAKEFIELYFKHFQGVHDYMTKIVKVAKKQGYVQTILQRRRYLPEINSSNFNLRSFAERTAMNTPIQGTAADIIKLAMVKLAEEIKQRKLDSRMLLQVHDELIFEVPEHELEIMTKLVPEIMENCTKLSVPLQVDVSIGDNWYDAK